MATKEKAGGKAGAKAGGKGAAKGGAGAKGGGAAAAGGIGLIDSLGNLGGFAAPYATGALEDLTGTDKAGMWAVGVLMAAGAALLVLLRAAPSPDGRATDAEYPRSQPTG